MKLWSSYKQMSIGTCQTHFFKFGFIRNYCIVASNNREPCVPIDDPFPGFYQRERIFITSLQNFVSPEVMPLLNSFHDPKNRYHKVSSAELMKLLELLDFSEGSSPEQMMEGVYAELQKLTGGPRNLMESFLARGLPARRRLHDHIRIPKPKKQVDKQIQIPIRYVPPAKNTTNVRPKSPIMRPFPPKAPLQAEPQNTVGISQESPSTPTGSFQNLRFYIPSFGPTSRVYRNSISLSKGPNA